MYATIREMKEKGDMSTIAERTSAKSVQLNARGVAIRGYDFVPSRIDEKERDFMFRSLFPVGLEAFTQNPSEAMEQDIAKHLFETEHLLVMRSDGTFSFGVGEDGLPRVGDPRPIAFRMWNNYDTPLGKATYLAGMCVLPAWQGTGIGAEMTRYVIEVEKPKVVFTVTQNPSAKKSMDNACGTTSYPLPGGLVNTSMSELGRLLADKRGLSDHFNDKTFVLKGHYGAPLYGKMPWSRDWRYQAMFERLDREAGDAYLCVTVL